ncbi:MAG: hypothetical protein QM270_01005, partial [Bacillota bacterium]|nr:hypothetical protein [Bacillota bacterium]
MEKNMKYKYVFSVLNYDKKHSVIRVLALGFAMFFSCTLLLLFIASFQAERNVLTSMFGQQDLVIRVEDETDYDFLRSLPDGDYGQIDVLGYHLVPGYDVSNSIRYGYVDAAAADMTRLRLREGGWAEQSGEAVIEHSAYLKLRTDLRVPFTISLNPAAGDSQMELRIVGVVDDYSHMQSMPNSTAGGSGFPELLINPESGRTAISAPAIAAYRLIRSPNQEILQRVKEHFSGRCIDTKQLRAGDFDPGLYPANELNRLRTMRNNAVQSVQMIRLLTGIAGLICTGLLLLLANRIVQTNAEQMYRLLCCGIKQHTARMLISGITWMWIGLAAALALMLMLVGIGLALLMQGDSRVVPFSHSLPVTAALLELVCVALCHILLYRHLRAWSKVRPQELIRRVETIDEVAGRPSRGLYRKRFRNPLMNYSAQSFKYYMHRLITTLVSIAMVVLMLLVAGYVVKHRISTLKHLQRFDYALMGSIGRTFSTFNISRDYTMGFEPDDLGRLLGESELQRALSLSVLSAPFNVSDSATQQLASLLELEWLPQSSATDPKVHEQEKKTYGFGSDEKLYACYINGVPESQLTDLQRFIYRGSLDIRALSNGQAVVLVVEDRETADAVNMSTPLTFSPMIRLVQDVEDFDDQRVRRVDIPVHICAIAVIPRDDSFESAFLASASHAGFIWAHESFQTYDLNVRPSMVYLQLRDIDACTRTNALIAELNTLYPDMQMYSYPQERAVQQGQLKSTERLSVT